MTNVYNCPRELWDSMSERKRKFYELLRSRLSHGEWATVNDKVIENVDILAHNASIMIVNDLKLQDYDSKK